MPRNNILTEKYILRGIAQVLRHSYFQTVLFSTGNTLMFNTNKYTYWKPR